MTESVCASCGRQKHVNASTICQDFTWHTPGIREDPKMDPVIEKTAKVIGTTTQQFAGAAEGAMKATLEGREKPPAPESSYISVLAEAANLIYGDREEQYGNAKQNFGDIATLWEPILSVAITPEQVALCLLQLKVARAINDVRQERSIKRDTVVDLAGYAGCIEKIQRGV